MKLSKKQVGHVAKLAKLELPEEEVSKFSKQLSSILEYVDLLHEVDVTDVAPIAQTTGLSNVTRSDSPQEKGCLSQKEVFSNVPETKDGHVATKAVL